MTNPIDGVTVTLAVTLKPEEAEGFVAQLPEVIKDTARFPGFRTLRVVRHNIERGRFLVIETWDSEADYAAYMDWRVKSGALEAMQARIVAPPQVDIWPTVAAKA